MKKYFLLIAVAGLFFTSCKKCKDCTVKVEHLSTSILTDEDCQDAFNMDCQEYYDGLYSVAATEYCGDELEAAEATADITDANTRIYWDCQ